MQSSTGEFVNVVFHARHFKGWRWRSVSCSRSNSEWKRLRMCRNTRKCFCLLFACCDGSHYSRRFYDSFKCIKLPLLNSRVLNCAVETISCTAERATMKAALQTFHIILTCCFIIHYLLASLLYMQALSTLRFGFRALAHYFSSSSSEEVQRWVPGMSGRIKSWWLLKYSS